MNETLNNFDKIDDLLINHVRNIEKLKSNIDSFRNEAHSFGTSDDIFDYISTLKLEFFKLDNSYYKLLSDIDGLNGLKSELQNLKRSILKSQKNLN